MTATLSATKIGLVQSLPSPKYTGDEEEILLHAQQRGPRILGARVLDESQIVLKVCN